MFNLWSSIKQLTNKVTADITALKNRILTLEQHLNYLEGPVNITHTELNQNTQKYNKTTYTRRDGTLMRTTLLMVDPDLPTPDPLLENLKIIKIYNKQGTEVLHEIRLRINYDTQGRIISETLL